MEYSKTKKEAIDQLKMVYDNLRSVKKIDEDIKEKKKELIDVEAEILKFKEESGKIPKFESTYGIKRKEFNKPNEKILNVLDKVYLIIYILLGAFLVVWSSINIVLYCKTEAVGAIIGYEIFLIGSWIIGGFILRWFKD